MDLTGYNGADLLVAIASLICLGNIALGYAARLAYLVGGSGRR